MASGGRFRIIHRRQHRSLRVLADQFREQASGITMPATAGIILRISQHHRSLATAPGNGAGDTFGGSCHTQGEFRFLAGNISGQRFRCRAGLINRIGISGNRHAATREIRVRKAEAEAQFPNTWRRA